MMLRTSVKRTLATQTMIEKYTAKPLAAASNAFVCLHVLCQKRLSNIPGGRNLSTQVAAQVTAQVAAQRSAEAGRSTVPVAPVASSLRRSDRSLYGSPIPQNRGQPRAWFLQQVPVLCQVSAFLLS